MQHILITGGAGFIGSHVADELLRAGHRVRIFDNLDPQVHGNQSRRPNYLTRDAEFITGDVRNRSQLRRALSGVDAVLHLAAAVGVGQSMYELEHYTSVNNLGSAVLLELLIEQPVSRLVVASSMSIYGEGAYLREDGTPARQPGRSLKQLRAGQWEPRDSDGAPLRPTPTSESKLPDLSSVYALNKFDQERLCLLIGQAYNIPTLALRFFNVYGPRQALSNPYTGVLAIFAARYLKRRAPIIYEDGNQQRDFVSVHDIARACRLALEQPEVRGVALNIGSGIARTINQIATEMAKVLGCDDIESEITGKYRAGDIRHCFADIGAARATLGYAPEVTLAEGLEELATWLADQTCEDRVEAAQAELARRGLTV